MELQLFIYKNVAMHFYYSKASVKNGSVKVKNVFAYFPGLPQIVDEDFFVKKVNKDTAFFSVNYLGSWLSGGKFTYKNCQKTIELVIEFIKNKKGIKTFDNNQINWDYKNLYVTGYSFSGNPIVSAKISKKDVKSVILFAPLFFLHEKEVSKYLTNKKARDDFYEFNSFFLEFLRRGYKFTYRGIEDKSWDTYFSGKEAKSFIKMDENYPKLKIFHGKSDKKINYSSSLFFKKEKFANCDTVLLNDVEHNLEKLFDMEKINKIT